MAASLSFFVEHLALLALMLVAAALAGTAVAGPTVSLALRSALGLAALGQMFVLLASAGQLNGWTIYPLVVALIVVGAIRQRRSWSTKSRLAGIDWRSAALFGTAAVPLLVLALDPPMAWDETLYHLPTVRALAHSGGIYFLPDLRFPAFPQLHEILCLPAYLALDDVATHLVALAEALIVASLLISWPRSGRRAGILAAAFFLGNPIVAQLASITYVEMAMTLFVAAGFVCLDRIDSDENRWWPPAAGFLLGTAASVKYLGLYFVFAAGAYLLLSKGRRRNVPLFVAGVLTGTLPMYGRILVLTGSPLFLYLPQLFGQMPWRVTLQATASPGLTDRLIGALRMPWDATFARERLNWQPPYSPLFAVALLITFAAAIRSRRAAMLSLLCAGYIGFLTFLPRDSRYLLSLVPLLGAFAAVEIVAWLGSSAHARTAIMVLIVATIIPGPAYAVYRLSRQGLPPVTAEQRRTYLERMIPGYRALERRGAGGIYVCGAEQLKYFAGDDLLGEVWGPFASSKILGDGNPGATELGRRLSLIGVRYFLTSRRACRPEWQRIPAEPAFECVYTDDAATLWRVATK